ncbi:serine/threonine-protein kinase tefu isoform X2 [Xylocopa sonorina]|uniref:serine/threonine-protein kinase tefu isoform X2 n=1 Tax=Xylocopa sonorina TaxID=1818115 RepID=UPI00403B1CDA
MSRNLERVYEVLKNANSKKVTEKKKCVTNLLELYQNEEAIKEISKNSEKNTQNVINWSYIVHVTHKLVINEASRLTSKDTHSKATMNERQNTCTVIEKTFQYANCNKVPLLKCKDIIPLILQILGKSEYEYYHDTYINVLISYILPFRIYQVKMLPEYWEELLNVCVNLCKRTSSTKSKKAVIEALQMIIKYGCLHSNLHLNVKEILLLLENIFLDRKADQEILLEVSYKLTNTVCQEIAAEYRITLCHFSENILPVIINSKDSNEKYKLLLLFVRIHHPKGACKISDGAYADDWNKWETILRDMYAMILKNFESNILLKSYLYLAAEVFKQILENPDLIVAQKLFNDYDYVQPTKRRRMSTRMSGPIDLLVDNSPKEAWPMVQVLTVLLKQYPECLKPEDYPAFLKILVDFLTLSCNEEDIMDNLYDLAALLLMNEKMFPITDAESSNISWDKIWDILLRSLNVNQNKMSAHKLTQLFIIHNKITNPNALLKLYLTNVIQWSVLSLRTLIALCEHLSLPTGITVCNINAYSPTMDSNSVRSCLIKWILNIPWNKMATQIIIDELCSLLISITLKSKYRKHVIFNEYNINNICDCIDNEQNIESIHECIEQCYLLLTYKKNLFTQRRKQNPEKKSEMNGHILYMQDILSYLMNSLYDIINESASDDLHIIIIKIAIVAKIISIAKQLNMLHKNIEEMPLVQAMKNSLNTAYSSLKNMNLSRSKYTYLCNVTKALHILYKTSYDTQVAGIIVSFATLDMLKNIFSLVNVADNDTIDYEISNNYYDGYGSFQNRHKYLERENLEKKECNFCKEGIIRIQATKALALFCSIDVEQQICEIQIKVMTNLLKINTYDLSDTVDLKMAIIVLKSLSKYGKEKLSKNHDELPLKNLLQLHQKCYKDEVIIRYILNVLPFFFTYAIDYNYKLDELMNIIAGFNKLRSAKKYGVAAHVEFIKCLSEIICTSPSRLYNIMRDGSAEVPIIEGILSSLNSSSFIVQIEIIKCIQEIFSSKNITFECKRNMFTKIEKLIGNLTICNEAHAKIKEDKMNITTRSILLILAAIISTNGTFQCHALLIMLRFTVNNKIDTQVVLKTINMMANQFNYENFIEDNLSYLMTHWYNSEYSSELFPWKITQCKTEEEFYKMYSNTLAYIKFQNLKLSTVNSFSTDVNIPFVQIVENIFPQMFTWLLYCVNEYNGSTSKQLASEIFHNLISNQNEFSQIRKFSNLFNNKFEEILICLVERLHDEEHLQKMLGMRISYAMSNPPHFKREEVNTCLKYIENCFMQNMSIQQFLVSNCPNVLQKILLYLNSSIYKKEFEEHRIKAFHQYIFFSMLIVEKLKEDYFNTLSWYIIKDIGYSLLHIIKMYADIRVIACKYFYKFVKHVLPLRSEQVKEILNFTVVTLVPIVETEDVPVALNILQFLLIDQKDILSDAIEKLHSFPNIPVFKQIRIIHNNLKYKTKKIYSLAEEVQFFLSTTIDKGTCYSVEDIAYLQMQLSTKKEEVRELYNKLETFRGFSEDCVSSMLHQLVYKLIKSTASSDINVSIEAVKCLGELGPTDLASMILYFEKNHVKESSDLIEILSYKIVIIMVQFLFQNDIELRKISANILYVIFSSSWGQKLLNPEYIEHLTFVLGESQTILPINYIQPFIACKSSNRNSIGISCVNINNIINPNNVIWTVESENSYSSWIIAITCKVAECFPGFYFENLIPICALSTDFCEIILPRIIFLIIDKYEKFTTAVCSCIDKFFKYHFNVETNVPSYEIHKCTNCDHRIVRSMLTIVNYIRMQISNSFLKLNYIHIAKAAQYCSAFFTAILYAEMSCEAILNDDDKFTNVSKIDSVYELSPQQGKVIQNILRDSYAKIGDFDSISGTGSSHLEHYSTRIQHSVYINEWDKVMPAQDVELSFGNMTMIRDMTSELYQSGLDYVRGQFIANVLKSGEKIDEDILYECAWRLSNWNICETNQALCTQSNSNMKLEITEHDYHFYHYQALKYFHEHNETGVQDAIRNARISIIKALRNISLESNKTIYEKLMQLQLIREIEELSFAKYDEYESILHKWQQQDIANINEFQYMEPILTQRTVMFQINDTLINNENIKHALSNTYLEISKIAADKGNLHIAARSLAVLAKQEHLAPNIQDQLLYQEFLLARFRKDLDVGRFVLRKLIHKETLDVNLRAQMLRVYGDWMAETKSENPQTVVKEYYLKSIDISTSISMETSDTIKNLHDAQVALARFADSQFEQICSYMKSDQFENLKECVAYSYKEINEHSVSKDRDITYAIISNRKQNTNDVAELEHIEKERDNYLILALKYYLTVLQLSESYNLLIFRTVALWLDNKHKKEVNELLQENLDKIPSFKFIPLVPQLAAHVNSDINEFSGKINNIMKRCALDHPHHTLPVLLGLKNLYGDNDSNTVREGKTLEPRILGAQKLLKELAGTRINLIILEMEKLSHALVMMANLSTTINKCSIVKIPRNQEILKIKNFENIFVPTLTINVKSTNDYNTVIGISKYVETYETVGGINTPKKLTCIGTDGKRRYQLVKGKDDLRQDAVMQQVFNVLNTLLKSYKETKRRKLAIRTYKVVPLTQRSGILEWCDNTVPIVTVLAGSGGVPGLHKKYYPNDYTPITCRQKLQAVMKSSNDEKLNVYKDCCMHMHPVMHYFFTEKYPSPETWFERRLAYTRSVATTSMAGYILGLGDRHLSNILIDQTTAEVIHIDFGIAFEQGKVLPIPETIPFRLTQNIEAGMGVSGVEGTMRHCCEKTLTVLRDQKQIIITLLQVLLYDPLFKWTITPAKAHDIQSRNSSRVIENNQCSIETNKTAKRALLRIDQKLQGTEEGLASSVSGQVERLIQQARDPMNLCRLFPGWQPYL